MDINKNIPVFITGAERSGATIIARVFALSGGWIGRVNKMCENKKLTELLTHINVTFQSGAASKFFNEKEIIDYPLIEEFNKVLSIEKYNGEVFVYKNSVLTEIWKTIHNQFPTAKWIIIRRKTPDIIYSCLNTGYMKMFRGAKDEYNCWLWRIHQYEETWRHMITAGLNVRIVWPDRLVYNDYRQIKETLEWAGLQWNPDIMNKIDPLFDKVRRKK